MSLTFKVLLLLAVRKGELVGAKVAEFNLKAAIWTLPAERTKTGAAIDIPLSPSAASALKELVRLSDGDTTCYRRASHKSRCSPTSMRTRSTWH